MARMDTWPGKTLVPHHLKRLSDCFERMSTEEIRVTLSVPPRHGKSQTLIHCIVWWMLRNPTKTAIVVSHTASLSRKLSRHTRDLATRKAGIKLRKDSNSLAEWATTTGGGCIFTSVGGPITGQGADLLIIDDPHKDRAEAESAICRENVWEWFQGTAYTRVEPGGSIILCHCLVGDTAVLMADGSEKLLREVRGGDVIATYADGALATSFVRRWANQGPDAVFAIAMQSGTFVRGNARHPFLVDRGGKREWIKLRDLRIGDKIVRATPLTERGEESCAPLRAAAHLPSARGSATPIMKRQGPQQDTLDPLTTPRREESGISGADMASSPRNTMRSCSSKEAFVPFADSPLETTFRPIGEASSASTTTTARARFAGCYATVAISRSDTGRAKTCSYAPLSTYAITLDSVVSITEDGTEDVFDIEVDATENFIANGLVSHNTRWHPEDLIGTARAEQEGMWEDITLPAISDDNKALWPERYNLAKLEEIRDRGTSKYNWDSQYQNRPVARGAAVFQGTWFFDPDRLPEGIRIKIGIDLAYSAKTKSDFSAMVVTGQSREGTTYILHVARAQVEVPAFAATISAQVARYPGASVHWHTSTTEQGIAQMLRSQGINILHQIAKNDKFIRAQPVAAAWNAGRVLIPGIAGQAKAPWIDAFVSEVLGFTGVGDRHDDMVDAMASAFDVGAAIGNTDVPRSFQHQFNMGSVGPHGAASLQPTKFRIFQEW